MVRVGLGREGGKGQQPGFEVAVASSPRHLGQPSGEGGLGGEGAQVGASPRGQQVPDGRVVCHLPGASPRPESRVDQKSTVSPAPLEHSAGVRPSSVGKEGVR